MSFSTSLFFEAIDKIELSERLGVVVFLLERGELVFDIPGRFNVPNAAIDFLNDFFGLLDVRVASSFCSVGAGGGSSVGGESGIASFVGIGPRN